MSKEPYTKKSSQSNIVARIILSYTICHLKNIRHTNYTDWCKKKILTCNIKLAKTVSSTGIGN